MIVEAGNYLNYFEIRVVGTNVLRDILSRFLSITYKKKPLTSKRKHSHDMRDYFEKIERDGSWITTRTARVIIYNPTKQ